MNDYLSIAKKHFFYLHKHPELSKQEYETTKYLIAELEKIGGFELDTNYPTGLVATINPGCQTSIAFRADIDALPIQEKTGLEYASINDGVMHACGHDFHTASLLTFAQLLSETKLNITIKLLFQPNEETTPGSSVQFINNHVLDDVQHVFGFHVETKYPTGTIGIKKGALYASIDDFEVTILGEGGHISSPQLTKNPLYGATNIISEMMNAITYRIDPINPPLIGVGTFRYGNGSNNIIGNEAYFCGTLRCLNEDTRKKSIEYFDKLVYNSIKAYDLEAEINWKFGEPSLFNDIKLAEDIKSYLEENSTSKIIEVAKPTYGGEDFSNYAAFKPSLFCLVGARVNDYDFHNDKFVADPEALINGVNLFKSIMNYFNNK